MFDVRCSSPIKGNVIIWGIMTLVIFYTNRSAKLDVLGDRVEKHCRAFLHVHVSKFQKDFYTFDFGVEEGM